jgi:cytochrome c oxidase cbb3-type subunit III
MSWSLSGYRTVTVIFCLAVICSAGQSAAQNANPQAVELPSGIAKEWLKVPEVNVFPGAVNPRPNIENPMAKDPSSAERGMKYFNQFNCVGCHAPNGGGGMGPTLSEGMLEYGSEAADIYLTISHGRPLGMPAWGGLLPDEVIWDLVSYVQSLGKAPNPEWGHTVSAQFPKVEQVPAEFEQTATPWQFTQPFTNGQKPAERSSTSQ